LFIKTQQERQVLQRVRRKIKDTDSYEFVKNSAFYFSIDEPNNVCYIGDSFVKIEKIDEL